MERLDDPIKNEAVIRAKFFTVPSNTNPVVIAIAKNIKQQDKQSGFVTQLANNAGYAIWDKSFVASETSSSNLRTIEEGVGLGQLVYIPFVLENEKYTNAVLIVKVSGLDTLYRLFYGSSYASLGFGTAPHGTWTAKDLFHTFITFDNELFGYREFIVKDKRLISNLRQTGDTTGEVKVVLKGTDQNFKLTAGISCHPIQVCGLCGFRTESITSYRCCNPTIESFCTTYWYDDGSGNISPPIGGGSSGGWQNPCRPIPGNNNPCSGSGNGNGWVPETDVNIVINKLTNPCIKEVFNLINNDNLLNTISILLTSLEDDAKYKFEFSDNYTGQYDAETTAIFENNLVVGFKIKLNPRIADYSKELITEIINHEIIHAWLHANNFPTLQHQTILEMIDQLVSADMEIWPLLPAQDAYANAFFGLSQLNAFDESAQVYQTALANHNLTLAQVESTYNKYSLGENGVKLGTRRP